MPEGTPTQRAPINTDLLDADSRALLDQYFPDHNLSIILKVAFENGYAKTLIPLLDRIYFSQTFSIPTIVVEAAQVLAHAICDNRYCAVFHAVNMVDLGLDPKEVKALIERQQLPSRYSDLKRWEKSLQLIAVQFHSPATANTLFAQLAHFHEGQELADLGALIAFCNLDRFILEFFSEEIDLHAEPMIIERASYSDDLVLSFTEIRGEEKPIVTMCSVCKAIQTEDKWLPIEEAIPKIPGNALFSHGYCPPCLEQTLAAEGLR